MPPFCYKVCYQARYRAEISWRCNVGEFGDKAEGELKDKGGQLSGDKKMEWEGKAQGVKGNIEGAGNEAKERGEEEADKPV